MFCGCTALKSISIPESVEKIDANAFEGCSRLTSIIIPRRVTDIGHDAFTGCTLLKEIHLNMMGCHINHMAFDGINSDDVTFYVPLGTEDIYRSHPAFAHIKHILPDDKDKPTPNPIFIHDDSGKIVIGIRDKGLVSLTVPQDVTDISDGAFIGCPYLESINVNPGNKVYDSRNGCNAVIETESDRLIAGCMNTVIPTGITAIAPCAFYGCITLSKITIPNTVNNIGADAFCGCSGLTELHVLLKRPNRTTIRANEFRGVDFDHCVLFVPEGSENYYRDHPAFRRFKVIKTQ